MAGFFVYEMDVFDQAAFDEYAKVARSRMGELDGRIIINSQRIQPLEGNWRPKSLVVARMPSFDAAREFYFSKEYQEMLAMRDAAANSRGVLVESDT